MARVVCVHGIGKQHSGEHSLLAAGWEAGIRDGLKRAGAVEPLASADLAMAYYGDLFRGQGRTLAVGDPMLSAGDVLPGLEEDLLAAWWEEAAKVDDHVVGPTTQTLVRAPGSVQAALRALTRSRFFANIALRSLVFDLKQVSRYLGDPVLRAEAQARVATLVDDDTEVVVAHSLGSVVAYEALCGLANHGVRALVTLGSPLGIRNLIFDRLVPAPTSGTATWPGGKALVWTNLADRGDVVALVKDLRPGFGHQIVSAEVDNGCHAHDAVSYLTDALAGTAIARGLGVLG